MKASARALTLEDAAVRLQISPTTAKRWLRGPRSLGTATDRALTIEAAAARLQVASSTMRRWLRRQRARMSARGSLSFDAETVRFYAKRLRMTVEILDDLGRGMFFDVRKARLQETILREGLVAVPQEDSKALDAGITKAPTRKEPTP